MASLFRARRTDEPGSGGKILRGRRAAPSASPYLRPEKTQNPPIPESENPRWFSGFISGAGKLLSSLFLSNDSDLSCSSDSDGDICDSSDEEDADACSKEYDEFDQTGKKLALIKNVREGPQQIAEKRDSKFAIEQLLLQETFTREECNKLTKIIQSRVVDHPISRVGDDEISKKLPSRTLGSGISFPGAWGSLNQERIYSEMTPYSACSLNDFSPGLSSFRAYTPDLCNTAITEAKKWLEEKKLASSSNSDLKHGPCTLNTDMLQYGMEGDQGSPVDMAKSYMQALPPWQSPILGSMGFKTPPRMHLYKDETPRATANHFLSLSTARKRNSLAIGSLDTLDISRNVRLKSIENTLEPPVYIQVDSSARMPEHEASQISSATDKRVELLGTIPDSSSLPATKPVDASAKFPAELAVKDGCPDGVLSASTEKAVEVNLPENNGAYHETSNHVSVNIISETEITFNAVGSILAASPSETSGGNESLACGPSCIVTDKNKDLEDALLIMEQVGSISVPHKSCIEETSRVEHNGAVDVVHDLLNSEPNMGASEIISNADEVTNHIDVHTSGLQMRSGSGKTIQDNNCSELDLLSGHKETDHIADSRSEDGNDQMEKELNSSMSRVTANGFSSFLSSSSAGLRADPSLEFSNNRGHNSSKSSNGELAAGVPVETCGTSSSEVPNVLGTNSVVDMPQNGTTMKSIKQMLTESPPNSSPGRGRGRGRVKRAAARPRRGRGKGN